MNTQFMCGKCTHSCDFHLAKCVFEIFIANTVEVLLTGDEERFRAEEHGAPNVSSGFGRDGKVL